MKPVNAARPSRSPLAVLGNVKGGYFTFLGMLAALFRERDRRPWLDGIQRSDHASTDCVERVPGFRALRADLGQSQSGSSGLSPRAYRARARSPNWSYERLGRSPLSVPLETSLGAPFRARSQIEKGGRTDRWPLRITLPSGKWLLKSRRLDWFFSCGMLPWNSSTQAAHAPQSTGRRTDLRGGTERG
jgi:hypothetical protein